MKCPGQDPRFWKFDAIFEAECPHCGATLEFFKDETRRTCKKCGNKALNPKMDFGCAAHCKFAEQCFGELPPELIKQRENLLKDRVAVEMKQHFKNDFKRIAHAARVARYVEQLAESEKVDPAVVLSAAYLHEVGIAPGEAHPDGSEAAAAAAREILERLEAPDPLIDQVCGIIGPQADNAEFRHRNFNVFHDADLIARVEEQLKKGFLEFTKAAQALEQSLLTTSGKDLARNLLQDQSATQPQAVNG
ncbi:MAG: HD domain-containing protein [Deltaproteobacteria bacterium]|nr:HD domain-containing protein [Deltaproteobacteria bacterium]